MKKAIICFTRIPIPSKTKTRLMPLLSGEQCAELHTAFLRDIASVCAETGAALFTAYTPDGDPVMLTDIFPQGTVFFPQEGADLGARMANALSHVLSQGYSACILIGADLPLLTAQHLHAALSALETHDMTLGPTSDGGYYLIGLRRPCPAVFENQQYSTASVFENTLAAAKDAGLTCCAAPLCDDTDTPEDLHRLWTTVKNHSSHTADCLRRFYEMGVIV